MSALLEVKQVVWNIYVQFSAELTIHAIKWLLWHEGEFSHKKYMLYTAH